MPKAYWAYDFASDCSLAAMEAAFNTAGPWRWQLRDSAVYGDYLNARPIAGVRVRIHEYPQMGCYGLFTGLRDKGFSALLEIDAASEATRGEIDAVFQGLLQRINATDRTAIEPYD